MFDDELIPRDYDDLPYCPDVLFACDTLDLPDFPVPPPPDPSPFHQRSDSLPPPERPPILLETPTPSIPDPFIMPFARTVSSPQPQLDADFQCACKDRSLTFKPYELGFLPKPWPQRKRTFGDLVSDFFTRKSSANSRFLHKLVNALKIAELDRYNFKLVGVAWISERVIKVDKMKFAQLLGVKTIDGSLFHKQGNFPSHGFVELDLVDARKMLPPEELVGVDGDVVRLVMHESGAFTRGNMPDIDPRCKWNGGKKDGEKA
jgi:hypothetical protein